jgi:surface carbohydrate biosynthesis protein
MTPRIALVLDNPQRDMAGLVLIAAELCRRGATCYLVPATLRHREIWSLAPDFVLLYHFRHGSERFIHQLAEAGIGFGVLDNEGGVWPDISNYTDFLVRSAGLRRQMRFLCAWGSQIADYLVEHQYFEPEQLVLTGCPRFDLYHPAWQSVIETSLSTENGRHEACKKRILVNTNYSEANPRFMPIEKVIDELCNVFIRTREEAMRLVETQRQTLEGTIELVRNLARDYPDVEIVVRPHPFEGTDIYLEQLGDIGNVQFNTTGQVREQIYQAAAVIQRTSTTAIETNLASVPALVPLWLPAAIHIPVVEAVSVPCHSYADMRTTLDAILNAQYQPSDELQQAVDTVIEQWFYRIDGLSHERVSSTIWAALGECRHVDEHLCRRYLYGLNGTPHHLRDRVARLLRFMFNLSPDWSFSQMRPAPSFKWTQTDQYFGAAEVRALVERMLEVQRANGQDVQPIEVQFARDRGDYIHPYYGHSVTLSCTT